MQGITDTDITFFSSMPKSGPLAGFGLIADGIQSYFDYINEQGGVDGRMLHLEIKDDGYAPDKTKTNVDEALGAGSYAGALTIIGTPNNLAVWDVLNDECMPQLLNGTGAPAVGRRHQPPVDHGHAARLRLRGRPLGASGWRQRCLTPRWPPWRSTTTSATPTSRASRPTSRAPTSRSSSSSCTSRRPPT